MLLTLDVSFLLLGQVFERCPASLYRKHVPFSLLGSLQTFECPNLLQLKQRSYFFCCVSLSSCFLMLSFPYGKKQSNVESTPKD